MKGRQAGIYRNSQNVSQSNFPEVEGRPSKGGGGSSAADGKAKKIRRLVRRPVGIWFIYMLLPSRLLFP